MLVAGPSNWTPMALACRQAMVAGYSSPEDFSKSWNLSGRPTVLAINSRAPFSEMSRMVQSRTRRAVGVDDHALLEDAPAGNLSSVVHGSPDEVRGTTARTMPAIASAICIATRTPSICSRRAPRAIARGPQRTRPIGCARPCILVPVPAPGWRLDGARRDAGQPGCMMLDAAASRARVAGPFAVFGRADIRGTGPGGPSHDGMGD